jgi:Spy/CpxP family protein refolding chaperone
LASAESLEDFMAALAGADGRKLLFTAVVISRVSIIQPTSNSSMKSTLKLSLAAMLLGLSVASLLRADDQPVQSGPSIQPDQSTPPGEGQKPPHPHMMNPQRTLHMLTERLNLTEDQQAKILPLLQAQADQIGALRNDPSLSDEEKHEQARTIMQTTRGQINALLTPEQQEKFASMRPGHGGPPSPPPPANNPPPPDAPPPPTN